MKITIYTQAVKHNWEKDFSLQNNTVELVSDIHTTYITLKIQEVEIEDVELDPNVLIDAEVSQIEQLKQELRAKTHVAINKFDEKIQSLLAIEDKS